MRSLGRTRTQLICILVKSIASTPDPELSEAYKSLSLLDGSAAAIRDGPVQRLLVPRLGTHHNATMPVPRVASPPRAVVESQVRYWPRIDPAWHSTTLRCCDAGRRWTTKWVPPPPSNPNITTRESINRVRTEVSEQFSMWSPAFEVKVENYNPNPKPQTTKNTCGRFPRPSLAVSAETHLSSQLGDSPFRLQSSW